MARRRVRYEADGHEGRQPEPAARFDESGVYARGQTVVPKSVREALGIEYGARLHWEVHEGVIHVTPIPKHPAAALRGILKGSGITFESFLQERQREREHEREQEQRWEREQKGRATS